MKLIHFQRLQIKLIYSPAKSMRNQTFSKIDVKLASKPRKPFLFEIHPHFLVYFICFYNQCNSTFLTPPGKIDEKSNIFQNQCQIGVNTCKNKKNKVNKHFPLYFIWFYNQCNSTFLILLATRWLVLTFSIIIMNLNICKKFKPWTPYFQRLQIMLIYFQRLQIKWIYFQRLQIKLIYFQRLQNLLPETAN